MDMNDYRGKNRLWSARKAAGLTQQQVAHILGYKSTAQISRWEKGLRLPNTVDLLKLSVIYHRLANDLLFDLYLSCKNEINHRIQNLNGNTC